MITGDDYLFIETDKDIKPDRFNKLCRHMAMEDYGKQITEWLKVFSPWRDNEREG